MGINRENYEAYLLDQMEGRLSDEEQHELHDFLAMNPDCAFEAGFETAQILPREEIEYPDKNALRKTMPDSHTPLSVSNFDLFSIARLEGDLTETQVREHELMLKEQPVLQSEWEQWLQTRLTGEDIVFPWKESLRHKPPLFRRLPLSAILSAAAAVALIAVLFIFRDNPVERITSEEPVRMPAIEQQEVKVPVTPPVVREQTSPEADAVRENALTNPEEIVLTEAVAAPEDPADQGQDATGKELRVSPRPLRAALAANTIPAPVVDGNYDRIRPLQIPETPVHMSGVSVNRLAGMNLQEAVETYAEEKDISIWTIANAGIKGINRITGSNIALFAARDDEGEVSGFQLKSKRLNISTPLERNE